MRYCWLYILFLLLPVSLIAGTDTSRIQLNQLPALLEKKPKPVVIIFSANWCSYCSLQEEIIRRDTVLQRLLKENFYTIRFDAESREPVSFNEKLFRFIPSGAGNGVHEFASALLSGNIGYPGWVILDPKLVTMFRHNGLLAKKQLRRILYALIDQLIE
ncbi:thioredoxin family protein [Sediminibacterium ginsengisoli]|uniref:Thioredoxin-like domain-containing protein n=1 Tax=Sediminibacterium ginsengisoli TaxID=413434 RepID=A0A1T4MMA2_9BACT|nr:thioredoxin family protein [Sediminibacterium ginsengisoli]SJZ68093.1 Thioredoxin-like domain-containing protein [Sediminibacterium ginsengisoli]